MSRVERDEAREYRINMEVIVDAYDEVEHALLPRPACCLLRHGKPKAVLARYDPTLTATDASQLH